MKQQPFEKQPSPSDFWDQRYATESYAYGTEPNSFFEEKLAQLKAGKILLPGEGEGRNAVYAAQRGWEVHAFDQSEQGQKKALKLAGDRGVHLDYQIHDYQNYSPGAEKFDCIGLFYTHMPAPLRNHFFGQLHHWLNQGGQLLLEGFAKAQILNTSGGPKREDMLFSEEELKQDFKNFAVLEIISHTVLLQEGNFHQGQANIIRAVAQKKIK